MIFEILVSIFLVSLVALATIILLQNKRSNRNNEEIKNLTDLQSLKDSIDNLKKGFDHSSLSQSQTNSQLSNNISELYTLLTKGRSGHQGQFGETSLRLILENSGMMPGAGFDEQKKIGDERPDFIVNLPEMRKVVIDSKVSLSDYSKYLNSNSDEERKILKKKHLSSIRNHIKTLSSTSYRSLYGSDTLDLVIMFMSVEGAYILACEDELLTMALKNKIAIVGPTTLIALLQIINRAWSNKKQSDDVLKIISQATAIYDDSNLVLESFEEFLIMYGKSKASIDKGIKRAKKLVNKAEDMRKIGGLEPKRIITDKINKISND
tara:strand:+ start:2786 stop:3751 length:966 start_codon:yes stop_codon:yes gene_type:complete